MTHEMHVYIYIYFAVQLVEKIAQPVKLKANIDVWYDKAKIIFYELIYIFFFLKFYKNILEDKFDTVK